ncbi:hypothetical protein [Cereibacter johrii]|uniref:hypothetical protein n=1 Tax=Cereibacter johrii TaxID=445629 RepID=UPI003CF92328
MSVDLDEKRPANGENFLNSDFSALILGNNVITFNAGRSAGTLTNYLHAMFRESNQPEAAMFQLVRIADVDQVRKIEAAGGVARVRIDLGIDEAAAMAIEDEGRQRHVFRRLRGSLVDMIDALRHDPGRKAGIAESTRGTMRLFISVPEGDVRAATAGMDAIAQQLVEDEEAEDFVIDLRNGDTIRPHEVSSKKSVRLRRMANTFDRDEVWDEMIVFLRELRQAGALE